MSSPPLSLAVGSAKAASGRVLQALRELAEALGTPGTVAEVLAEAKVVLTEAEVVLERLQMALQDTMAAAPMVPPTVGLNAERLYRDLGTAADASASELKRELYRKRWRRRGLWVVRTVSLVLLLLCAPLLSLDMVREALGVTQESHLIPCLATIALVSQVALWGARTSKRHLDTAANYQHQQALRYRRLARDIAAATATNATEATTAANATLGLLEELVSHLKTLVDAVTQDLEIATGFPASARVLGDVVVALGTVMEDKEGLQRLARALEALPEAE